MQLGFPHAWATGQRLIEFVGDRSHFKAGRTLARTIYFLACATAFLPGCATAGLALEPNTSLANYGRQVWAMENGLPQNTVQALVQTKDGFLWLGTEVGLVRFDGVAFQTFDRNSNPALPGNDIRCLLETGDGALWIGTNAGLARWKDGRVTSFSTQDGLPSNGILTMTESGEGKLRLWTEQGEAYQAGDRFRPMRDADAFARTALPSPGEYPKAAIFEQRLEKDILVVGGRGEVEIGLNRKSPGVSIRLAVGKELPGSRIQVILADREGALWIGTNAGLARWTKGKVERFPITDPLAASSIIALMEDREGNLWVGTEADGLHILRDQRFKTLGTREGLSSDQISTVVEDAAGTLWAGTEENGLNALRQDKSGAGWRVQRRFTVENGLASNVILSLAASPNGDLWVGTPDGLNRIHENRVDTFTSADGLPDDFIRSLLVDSDGYGESLWIGTRRGLTHWAIANGGSSKAQSTARMKTFTHGSGLGSDLVGAMTRDQKGDLWVATLAGLSRLHGDTISNFTTADGLSNKVVTALLPRVDGRLLIGTQGSGWEVWDGSKFSQDARSGLEQTTIHAILDDGRGHFWFATGDGIARCKSIGAGTGCSSWIKFGANDGLHSRETAANSHPSAWRSSDGQLWFATPKGLVEVDPAHFRVNALPPSVAMERFQVDDGPQPLRDANAWLKVAAGHVHFEFDYAGLSFVAPQKARYRFMLEGFDRGWTEAGTRRAAYYTNIPPGRYTFRVQAANNDGLWSTTDAVLSFELLPHLYQTIWFYLLLLAMVASAVVWLLRQRLRRAEREFGVVLGERSRIAREIHDTLAQGYVGVSVQLEVLAEMLRQHKVEEAAQQLDQAREYVRDGLADARQSIWALRTQDASETTLPVKLRRMAEAACGSELTSEFSLFGAYRRLPEETERELLRVAQEAIHNVKKHAGASRLCVQLEFGSDTITLEIRDNGRGSALERTEESLSGHFGLTGMRERAAAIGGRLEVSSEPGTGTTIRLWAPTRAEVRE